MNIITGYRAAAHVTAQQDRDTNIGIFGAGVYILNVGSLLAAEVISANEVQISDGLLVAEGCTAEIERGTTESLAISNGSQGMLRTDLIVARYTKDSGTGVESMALVVVEGTPAASDPSTPSYNDGTIADGDTVVDFPVYQVNIDGINISSVDALVGTVDITGNITDNSTAIAALQAAATKTTGTPTTQTGSITADIKTVEKRNNVGEMWLKFTTSSALTNSETPLFLFPAGYRPSNLRRFTETPQGGSRAYLFTLYANGYLYVSETVPQGLTFYITRDFLL